MLVSFSVSLISTVREMYFIGDNKLDEANLKIIDASLVPDKRVEKGKWELIFEKIPLGKALVLEEKEASESAVRTGLYDLQGKGKFQNFIVRKVRKSIFRFLGCF